MTLARTGDLVADARTRGRAALAFNVITLEHAEGIARGAGAAGTPVILQVSHNAVRHHGDDPRPVVAASVAVAAAAAVPCAVHLDHVEDDALLHAAGGTGASSAMYDASAAAYDENVRRTRTAADWAHAHDVWLEAELGEVGGKRGAHAPGVRTDPAEAAAYVAATGVDALAVAVGSEHAMTARTASLDHDLIARLRDAVPVPLVLHGSSGVPDDDLVAAVAAGMVKINVGTALNVAFTGAVRAFLAADEQATDPRTYLAPGRDAIAAEVARLLKLLAA